ncbi:unnamed protein product, partial [Rhizoctonia solani]
VDSPGIPGDFEEFANVPLGKSFSRLAERLFIGVPRDSQGTPDAPNMNLTELPQDILYKIGQTLNDSQSISSLCTVNKCAYQSLHALLYHSVKLGSDLSVSSFCDTIISLKPDYSKYVVSLQIGPEWLTGNGAYYELRTIFVLLFRPVLESLVHLKHLSISSNRTAFDLLFDGLDAPFQLETFINSSLPSNSLLGFLTKQPSIKRLGCHAIKTHEDQKWLLELCELNPDLLPGLEALESPALLAVFLVGMRPISNLTILEHQLELIESPEIASMMVEPLTQTMVPITHICVTEPVGKGNKWMYFIRLLQETSVSTSLKEIDVIQRFTPVQNQALFELVFEDIYPQWILRFTALERFEITQAGDVRRDVPTSDVLAWLTQWDLRAPTLNHHARPQTMMHNGPNRMGLGLRAPMPNYQPTPTAAPSSSPMLKATTLFVGSISPGISDGFLTSLFAACGPLRSFKRLQTPQGKPQAFGFAEFEEPDAVVRALQLLDGSLLPSLEGGPPKKLSVKADQKTQGFLKTYEEQRGQNPEDEVAKLTSETLIGSLIAALTDPSALPQEHTPDKSNEVIIPPHLQDLQEQDLPEEQRGLVLSEISLFRERSARRDKPPQVVARQQQQQQQQQQHHPSPSGGRTWGQPQLEKEKGESHGLANKPIGFVQAKEKEKDEPAKASAEPEKTDEEREKERLEARRRDEDNSFRDRERRYEPRERQRIAAIDRAMQRERGLARAEDKDRQELRQRLAEWDDDASDEPFYVDRARWRQTRHRFLLSETQADDASRALEERQAEHLRLESEAFLARQMDEMRALAEEQRKAGLLLDDGAPVRLAISAVEKKEKEEEEEKKVVAKPVAVFGQEEEEETAGRRRRGNLVKLDFEAAERERLVERLHRARDSVPKTQDALWRAKVKWDALRGSTIQDKIVPLARKKLEEYLGELDDDDMVVFIADHVRSRKGPAELVEALEPVLVEEATDLVLALWRQVVFESAAYGDGLETGNNFVDQSGAMVPA